MPPPRSGSAPNGKALPSPAASRKSSKSPATTTAVSALGGTSHKAINGSSVLSSNPPFQEPPLAAPMPSITGLPLSAFPNSKIKKERLWPVKRGKPGRPKKAVADKEAAQATEREKYMDDLASSYEAGLKTTINEKIQKPSAIRSKTKPCSRDGASLFGSMMGRKKRSSAEITPLRPSTAPEPIMTQQHEQQQLPKKVVLSVIEPKPPLVLEPKPLSSRSRSKSKTPPEPVTPQKRRAPSPFRAPDSFPSQRSLIEKDDHHQRTKIKNSSPKKARRNAFGFETAPADGGAKDSKRQAAPEFDTDTTRDNEDFCSACGESGIFLCCESCPRSFHFACCDPPYSEQTLPDAEWFCNECFAKKNPPGQRYKGLFGKLLNQVPYRNPIRFQLPKKLRERFEGISTGPFGEYEDADTRPFNPSIVYAFDQFDPAHHYDKNGDAKVCAKCGESGLNHSTVNGGGDKLIAQCEYCPSAWHLDCLNPPLSTVKLLGKKWKCPNHADHLIVNKQRRLKKPTIVDVDQTRGYKNNGQIEIASDDDENDWEKSSDDEKSTDDDNGENAEAVVIPTPPHMKTYDTENGVAAKINPKTHKQWLDPYVIPRIPAKGIVLDFIGKVRDAKAEELAKVEEIWRLSKLNNEMLTNFETGERQSVKGLMDMKTSGLIELANACDFKLDDADREEGLEDDEIEELLLIKKLIKRKGKKKMLAYLKNKK